MQKGVPIVYLLSWLGLHHGFGTVRYVCGKTILSNKYKENKNNLSNYKQQHK